LRERQRALEAVAEGIGDAEEGRVYDHKSIRTWLTSWGTDAEVEPPR
jgi:predicted transcriptional regulator